MFSQSLRPPCATGMTWSNVRSEWEGVAAVLAPMPVARVDVRAREGHVVDAAFDPDEPQQAYHRRQLEADRDGVHLAVVDRDHLDLPLAEQGECLAPVDDLQRLVGRIEQKRLLHAQVYWGNAPALSSNRHPKIPFNIERLSPGIHRPGYPPGASGSRCHGPIIGGMNVRALAGIALGAAIVDGLARARRPASARSPSPRLPSARSRRADRHPLDDARRITGRRLHDRTRRPASAGTALSPRGHRSARLRLQRLRAVRVRLYGIALPRVVRDQYHTGRKASLDDVVPGDLVFFVTQRRRRVPRGHRDRRRSIRARAQFARRRPHRQPGVRAIGANTWPARGGSAELGQANCERSGYAATVRSTRRDARGPNSRTSRSSAVNSVLARARAPARHEHRAR